MMEIKTNVFQSAGLKGLFAIAPEDYRKTILAWLIKERGLFVGDRKKDGTFTKQLLRKAISGSPGETWSRQVAKSFKGYIRGERRIEGMTLLMGQNLSGSSKFARESLAKMEDGYTQNTGEFMIMPVLRNNPLQRPRKLMLRQFHELLAEGKLRIIRRAGRIYYYDYDYKNLLFVGSRTIKVKKQFDFISSWEKRIPAVIERGQKAIEKQTKIIATRGI